MSHPSRNRRPSLWVPLFLLVVLFVWFNRGKHGETPSSKPGGAEQQDARTPGGTQAKGTRDAANRAPLAAVEPTTSFYQRGENKTLLYPAGKELQRQIRPGTMFSEPVFALRKGGVKGTLSLNEHTFSAVEAAYDPDVILRFVSSGADSLRIPLQHGREVKMAVKKVIARGERTHTLIGQVEGDSFSDVLLVFHDGAVSGSVAFNDRNEHFEFGLAGNGDIAIRHLNPATYDAPCGDPGVASDQLADGDTATPREDGPDVSEDAAGVVMDTVVGYDIAARTADGGVAGIEARIMASVDRMNQAFTNSLVANTTLVLLGTVEDPDYVFPGKGSGMGSADELGDLDNSSTGNPSLNTVTNLRNQLGADQASFVLKQADGSAGIAYQPGRSMIVGRDYMTSTRLTFEHEFGHNIGLGHAWADGDIDDPKNAHNYGWRFDPPGSAVASRTIMAYDWYWGDGARVVHFSNPDVLYNGARTGAVDGYNATGDATADPRAVNGGYIGGAGAGYDGTNPNLGARNGDYIEANAPAMAARATRVIVTPEIDVLNPDFQSLASNGAAQVVSAPGGAATTVTFTIRNRGIQPLTGVAASIAGPQAAAFAVTQPGATIEGSASNTFQVTFTPTSAAAHAATLQIASNDSDENPFVVPLSGIAQSKFTFTGGSATIPASGNANPYPVAIVVSGVTGNLLSFKARLHGLDHAYPDDMDIFLMSPSGRVCALVSDAGGSTDISGVDLVFSDTAAASVPDSGTIVSGEYKPTNYGTVEEALPPGGNGSLGTSLAALTAGGVNGTWKIFLSDDSSGDAGSLAACSIVLESDAPVVFPETYDSWAAAASLSGDHASRTAIPHGDTVPNLLKFAFNLDGSKADSRALVPLTGEAGLPVSWLESDGSTHVFEFLRRTNGGLEYEPLQAEVLPSGNWQPATGTLTTNPAGEGWERVQIRQPASEGKRFFVVRVTPR